MKITFRLFAGIFALAYFSTTDLPQAMAQTSFTEVSISSGINQLYLSQMRMGGGVAFFDFDKDGDEDLVLSGGLNPNKLYRNDGNGQFADVTSTAGLAVLDGHQTMGVVTGDIDNDGYREIFFTTMAGSPSLLLYNNGDGTFTDITQSSGIGADTSWGASATFGDVNQDGLLDIYVANYLHDMVVLYDSLNEPIGFNPTCLPNHLYINQGNLTFLESAGSYGVADSGCGLATAFTHTRGNTSAGIDILVANDHGMWNIPNKLFRNQHPSTSFSDESQSTGMDVAMYGMGIAVADYDHDQDLDYYITDIGPNKLMQHDAISHTYADVALAAGVRHGTFNGLNTTGWGTAFFDVDNDSWDDLFLANGYITVLPFIANTPADPDKLFKNMGNGTFSDISTMAGVADTGMSRGMAYSDFDMDGDMDFAVASIHYDTAAGAHTLLYRNDLNNGKHFISFDLEGTISNRDAFGARVIIQSNLQQTPWIAEVSGGNNHMSHNSSRLHFGLDTTTVVDQILVIWPNGGMQAFYNLQADSLYHIVEDSSQFITSISPGNSSMSGITAFPNPTSNTLMVQIQGESGTEGMLILRDYTGKQIGQSVSIRLDGSTALIDLTETLPSTAGMYFIEFATATEKFSCKIIRVD